MAIYTASLASFMITREEWDNFKGLDDPRVKMSHSYNFIVNWVVEILRLEDMNC